jgi:2-polyprenyl-3-methyl-5-hydroxy-6-metoxy-1,4-benzoquinol methylase
MNSANSDIEAKGHAEDRPITVTPADWNNRYATSETPWDSGIRSRELACVLETESIPRRRACELGCGSGTNAVYLAQQGFQVTAMDCAPLALKAARRRAKDAGVEIEFLERDLARLNSSPGKFDFVFDRGCFHCVRRTDLPGFLRTLEAITHPGTRYLVLTGNANEQTEGPGPPRLTEEEIRNDLSGLFTVDFIREIRFEDAGGVDGPLGWSCLLTRRGE